MSGFGLPWLMPHFLSVLLSSYLFFMHSHEKPIILVVTTLFLAFTLVYMMFFRIRDTADIVSPSLSSWSTLSWSFSGSDTDRLITSLLIDATTWSNISWQTQTGIAMTWAASGRVVLQSGDESASATTTLSWWVKTWSRQTWSVQTIVVPTITPSSSETDSSYWYDRIDKISGATAWYNSVKMAEVLGLDMQVVFADTGAILYGYLGTGALDQLASTVKRLQWNILAIDTQIDIVKNWLPWDRIRYINIPQLTFVRKNGVEEKLLVAMIVDVDDDQWLIQAPYGSYHASKKRMIEIFTQLYK